MVLFIFTKEDGIILIRIWWNDGMVQIYNIKSYKDTSSYGSYCMSSGVWGSTYIWTFECKILVMDVLRLIKVFYHAGDGIWTIQKWAKDCLTVLSFFYRKRMRV